MSEFYSESNVQPTVEESFMEIVGIYYPEDVELVAGMNVEEKLNYIYTRMLGGVTDPALILSEFRQGRKSDEI